MGRADQASSSSRATVRRGPVIYRPMSDRSRYFILTSAQDSSKVHEGFWKCLNNYAEWLENCEIIVSGFTYSKRCSRITTPARRRSASTRSSTLHHHERILIGNDADGVDFCGEMNTLPTAVLPLSGFTTYTRIAGASSRTRRCSWNPFRR
jgi:hypothetical protein